MTAPRHDEIVRSLEELIQNGQLRPGDRLPSERALARDYGVSRNTVREAIKAMTEKMVVVSRRGAGTFVAEGALACMIHGAARRRKRLHEIFELRKLLEPQIASLAAQRITASGLLELEEIVASQQAGLESAAHQARLDERFHRTIAKAAENSVLFEVYETLHDLLSESRGRELQSRQRSIQSHAHHGRILAALRNHQPETAAQLMRCHMEEVEHHLSRSTPDPPDPDR